MIQATKTLYQYRELLYTLAWKDVTVRYKQAYLGMAWAILQPLALMLIFTVVRSFVGIETPDGVPYPILTFAALMPWTFFQQSVTNGVSSVVSNTALVRKIYFPREIFPITAVIVKLIDLGFSFIILAGLMVFYRMMPTLHILWVIPILVYAVLMALSVSMLGSAINVYYRDVAAALPLALQLAMYVSPIIYPLSLVHRKLIEQQALGEWSNAVYQLYLLNPLVGLIDGFQRAVLYGKPPEFSTLWPGILTVVVLLTIGYRVFKRAENFFADAI